VIKGVGMTSGVFLLFTYASIAFAQDVTFNGGQVVDECIGGTGPVMVDYLEATRFTKGYELATRGHSSGAVTFTGIKASVDSALENAKYYVPELEPFAHQVAGAMLRDLEILIPYTHGAERCTNEADRDLVDLTCVNSKLQTFSLMLEGSLEEKYGLQLLATRDVQKYRFSRRDLRNSGCKVKNLAVNIFGNFGKAPFLQVAVGLLHRMNAEQIAWFVVHESFLSAMIQNTQLTSNSLELSSDPARRLTGFAFSKEASRALPDRAQRVMKDRHFDRTPKE
jgi:hypothetical protein